MSEALAEALAEPRFDAELAESAEALDGSHALRAGRESDWLRSFLWLSRCAYELEQDSWAGLRRSVWA